MEVPYLCPRLSRFASIQVATRESSAHRTPPVQRRTGIDTEAHTVGVWQRAGIDAGIWVTDYRDRTNWIDLPGATDAQGWFVEERSTSPVPGLFYIGRSWQTSRGSALVTGVGAAAALAPHITQAVTATPATAALSDTEPALSTTGA